MPDADTFPLAFGQLSVWRVMEDWPLDRWSETYLCTAVPVPDGCPRDRVIEAFGVLCERHESLRTHFADTPQGPVQRVRPAADPVEVSTVECPGATKSEAEAVSRELTRERIDREGDFARRFTVVTDGDRATYAVIVVDHIVADGFGLRRLCGELTALMGGDDPDGQQWLGETPPQPSDLALAQRSHANRARREAAVGYWNRLLDTLPSHLFPVPDEAGNRPGRIEAVLRSPGARSALGRTSRRMSVPPQGILLALNSLATAVVTGTAQVVLTLQSSNRFTAPWRSLVSSMNQYTPLPLDVSIAPDTFAQYAKHVQGGAFKAYRFGSYDIDTVTTLVRAKRGIALGFDHFYNFMAHDVPTGPDIDVKANPDLRSRRIEVTRPKRQIGPRFDVKVHTGSDMPIFVRADPQLIPQPCLHALLAWYDEELHRLADSGSNVSAMLARCAGAIGRHEAR
ncbi:condensation domain-containing protein [Streptomyces lydicus]|uniref:condensation domain-containing protein n=1 Tax=Streptomyces lydicus TaxID=47763 RepID=UPI0036F63649